MIVQRAVIVVSQKLMQVDIKEPIPWNQIPTEHVRPLGPADDEMRRTADESSKPVPHMAHPFLARCHFLLLNPPRFDELLPIPISDLQSLKRRLPVSSRHPGQLVVPQRAVPLVCLAVQLGVIAGAG